MEEYLETTLEAQTSEQTVPTELATPTPPDQQSAQSYFYRPCDLKVAAALMRAQAKFDPLLKDTANPFYKSKYATLDQVIAATRPHLRAEGLIVLQRNIRREQEVGVVSRLLHVESGEELTSELTAPPDKFNSQGIGSVITYLRRYDYQTLTGVAPEDDDGTAASGTTVSSQSEQRPQYRPPTATYTAVAAKPNTASNTQSITFPAISTGSTTASATTVVADGPVKAVIPSLSITSGHSPAIPTPEEFSGYVKKVEILADTLEKAGLKAGRGLPVKSKLGRYVRKTVGIEDIKAIPHQRWEVFFAEFGKLIATPEGIKQAVEFVEAANVREAS